MRITSINAAPLSIPFKQAFKHASAQRSETQTLWVRVQSEQGNQGCGESCPREYVTGETLTGAQAFVRAHETDWQSSLSDLASLQRWVDAHETDIDAHPAAWSAVELALLDLLGKEAGVPIERLLGLQELTGRFEYTAVLGDASPQAFEAQLGHYLKAGFRQFKIKLSGDAERDASKVAALKHAGIGASHVRADANNLWQDAPSAIAHLRELDFPFCALEEPLTAGAYAALGAMADALGCRIILDESCVRAAQLRQLPGPSGRWIVNLRVSKMGGLLRSLAVAGAARALGVSLIIGAHVGETSLLTRAALTVAHASRDILLAQEGAFGTHLLAHDVIDPPLMFGAAGMLSVDDFGLRSRPGLGLDLTQVPSGAP